MANPKSTASIAGHPIHPMLIPFPIAFFVATFLCDLAYWQSPNAAWATAAIWLLGAGIVMAALAALAGLTDVIGDVRVRALDEIWWHAGGNAVVVLLEIYNWYARYTQGDGGRRAQGPDHIPDRRRHSAVHRLEGLGDGLPRTRRRCGQWQLDGASVRKPPSRRLSRRKRSACA